MHTHSDNWDKFRQHFKNMIPWVLPDLDIFSDKQEYINDLWSLIEKTIFMTAETTLPTLKTKRNKKTTPRIKFSSNPLVIDILHLAKIK